MVYESKATVPADANSPNYTDRLQLIGHEEGRIRFKEAVAGIAANFQYDYMLKDHLGNVRMVLTEEQLINSYPAAKLEGTFSATGGAQANSMINTEKGFYNIDNTKVTTEASIVTWPTESTANTKLYYNNNGNPPANINYPASFTPTQTDGSSKLYKLNATANKTGLEFMIKVMAGDKIDIFGKSYFLNTGPVNNSNSTPLNLLSLMTTMLLAPANAAASKGISAATLNTINTGQIPNSFFRGANGESTTIPKAYINYIFLDEQFKYAGGDASRVGTSGQVKDHWYVDPTKLQNISVPKNGYIFVYVSNESNLDVFFDNLQVIHKPGPILEETHYYPFGLTMAGISTKAAGITPNKENTFQDQRFDDDLGLNWVQFKWRNHDPQIGRFIEIDPLSEKYVYNSTYAFSENKVIAHVELEGLESCEINMDREVYRYTRGEITAEQYSDNIRRQAIGGVIGTAVVLAFMYPQAAQLLIASHMSGMPLNGAPQMMAESVASSTVASESAAVSEGVSMANKARVLTAGGEIGLMDGAANLAVDAKTGFFNISVQAGSETGVITGEINISNNSIGFNNLEIVNAKGGLGSISQQNSIGPESFLKLQKEITELSKAGGFNKGTLEFSRLRPPGSPLPDTETRIIPLFDNTVNQ